MEFTPLPVPAGGYILALLFGLIVGSFFNVAIWRIPRMLWQQWHQQCREFLKEHPDNPNEQQSLNLFIPRSHCPHCGHLVRAWQNIPVFSYIFLRGRCYDCQEKISLRYPLVEALTALLAVLVLAQYGFTWQASGAALFSSFLLILIFIDIDEQLLPDQLTLSLLWLGLLFNLNGMFCSLPDAVIGATAGYLSLWCVANGYQLLTGKEGMGYGDFKLLAACGAWLGWQLLPFILLAASFFGALLGVAQLIIKKASRDTPIPFGPYLAIAAWVALLWGDDLIDWYLQFLLG